MTDSSPAPAIPRGMSAAQARNLRVVILGVCTLSLIFIFQPFSLTFYTIGAGAVVFGGLAFNLIPLCEPGTPMRSVIKAAIIVAVIFFIVTALAIASAALYATYLRN